MRVKFTVKIVSINVKYFIIWCSLSISCIDVANTSSDSGLHKHNHFIACEQLQFALRHLQHRIPRKAGQTYVIRAVNFAEFIHLLSEFLKNFS